MNLKGTKKKNQVITANIFEQQELLKKAEVIREKLTASTWHELETNGKFGKNEKLSFVSDDMLILGCDVGSDTHYVRAIDTRGRELSKSAFPFSNTLEGFQGLMDWATKLAASNDKEQIILGLEPTGHYWFCLATWLIGNGISVVQVNPYAVKQTKEVEDNSQLKDDRKDPKLIANLVKDGSKATVDGKEYAAMNDADGDGVDDDDSSIISTTEAKKKIKAELLAANSIGTVNRDATVSDGADANGKTTYTISKGYATVADTLSFNLHVGADADMTNKITVDIDVMNSANLGVKGLNVTDATGTAATYAVDAISDAIAKVSSQRSALGAVQNRLEHTIDNLDNIVENTTTAESRIRDTDMAEEMVEYSKNNILAQAGQSMLAQANQSTQGVLSLLQ